MVAVNNLAYRSSYARCMPGWIAHWREQNLQGSRISRPRQIYTGPTINDYVPRTQRDWVSDSAEDIIPNRPHPIFDL